MTCHLSPQQRRRFRGVLGRLHSNFDSECAAAALLATRMLQEAGLNWETVLGSGCHPAADRPASWRDNLSLCLRHTGSLRPWEIEFTRNVGRQANANRKQRDVLAQIAHRLRDGGRS